MAQPYTPRFLQPDPEGQLSNSASPVFKARYMNGRGSADPAGQVRFTATRISSAAAVSYSPNVIWDTGWLGAPTVTAMPVNRYSHGCAQYRDRVYICGGIDSSGVVRGDVWSASIAGGSVGTWRQEKPMAVRPATSSGGAILIGRHGHACTAATFGTAATSTTNPAQKGQGGNAWLIVYGGFEVTGNSPGTAASASMIAAPIYADGTLGDWITISYTGWSPLGWCHLLAIPNQYMTSGLVLSGGVQAIGSSATNASYVTMIRNAPQSAQSGSDWDLPDNAWWHPLTTTGAPQTAGHNMAYDWPNATLLWFKGANNAGGPQSGFFYCQLGIDTSLWNFPTVGSSWGAGSAADGGLTSQNNAGLIYFDAQWSGSSGGNPTSFVYILGGTSSSSNVGDTGSPLSNVRYTTLTWNSSSVPSAATWSAGTAVPAAAAGVRAFIHEHGLNQGQLYGYPPWCDPNIVRISELGGATGIGAVTNAVRTASLPAVAGSGGYTTSGGNVSSWISGTGAGLASSDLGTGGSVVNSSDSIAPAGSQDVTIAYGQITASSGLSNGDQVRLDAQFTDKAGGDPSPVRSTVIRVGQAPTISNLSASAGTGQPTVSWSFNAGSGGGTEYSWRCLVTRNSDSLVMFDSGTRQGQTNSVQVQCAPMLVSGVAYTATVTVTSTDNPMSGSSNSTSAGLPINPNLAAAPLVPSSVTASGDATNKWMLLSWTNGTGATGNRIYYRYSGTTSWRLLVDNYTAGTGAQSVKLMDRIPLGAALDFSVSALGGSAAVESAQSAVASATVPPDTASPSGYLHLAGQSPTGVAGVTVVAQNQPKLSANFGSKSFTRFGASRAVVRQSPRDTRNLELEILSVNSGNVKALEALVDSLLQGGVVYWRDRLGTTLSMALDTPEDVQTIYPNHRSFTLRLIQVDDVYSPYLTSGSAIGIPTLFNGSVPALDDATEQVA